MANKSGYRNTPQIHQDLDTTASQKTRFFSHNKKPNQQFREENKTSDPMCEDIHGVWCMQETEVSFNDIKHGYIMRIMQAVTHNFLCKQYRIRNNKITFPFSV